MSFSVWSSCGPCGVTVSFSFFCERIIPCKYYTKAVNGLLLRVRPEGLEPSTFGTGIQRSIQLNYGRLCRVSQRKLLGRHVQSAANIRKFRSKKPRTVLPINSPKVVLLHPKFF